MENRLSRIALFNHFRLLILLSVASASAYSLQSQVIYALSGNNLISFQANAPSTLLSSVAISGIAPGQSVAGLDFRPNTGELYAMGYNQATGQSRLYTVNLSTGMAMPVGAVPIMLGPNLGKIGMDFNPTVDRIRVTSSSGGNFRLHPVTGALLATDLNLSYNPMDLNAGTAPSVGAVAYTNSYIASTSTTLYNFDFSLNVLTTQIPPNDGVLNTVGNTGVMTNMADPTADLDIYFDPVTGMNRAFLAANTGTSNADNLYTVNLSNGVATLVGPIGNGMPISDIAVFIDRNVPSKLTGQLVYALTSNGNLISFDAAMPGVVRSIVPVSGIPAGQMLAGMDIRPATGELYLLGYNNATGEARLYTLAPSTGAASGIGNIFMLQPNMSKVSMDFNPTVDRIRVTGSNNANYRLHPVTGALVATDGNLKYSANDINAGTDPSVGTGAYTNSFDGATNTVLYNYDDSLNVLTTQIPPNDGVLNTVGMSGIMVNLNDPSSDLDILYNPYSRTNTAYLAANVGNSTFDNLYTVNLATSVAAMAGRIGNGIAVTDIAVSLLRLDPACDVKMSDCVRYEILDIVKDAAGNKTYRFRVTNNCSENLVYVAFQLPNGVTAKGPATGSFQSVAGKTYEVRNPNLTPFRSVRFRDMSGNGIANGQSDVFEYTLPPFASPTFIRAASRVGTTVREAQLNVFGCPVTNAASGLEAEERDEWQSAPAAGAVRVYPNPTDGPLFADLTDWEGQQVQVNIISAQGQVLAQQAAAGGLPDQAVNMPANLPVGFYFVEFVSDKGERAMRKVVLR
jgi:hypothetical protein